MILADIAGQEHALAVLRRALQSGRLAHAYLFDGPAGVGKARTALGLGLALACPEAPREGCGRCLICQRVLAGNHPDVLLFDAAQLPELTKASSEKSAVKYAARQVFPYALQAPHEAPARLLIIDNADQLSPDVQNTLLKTLEEPRPAVHIVLVTAARDRLLPTILSRTQRVRFVSVRAPVLLEIAERHGVPVEQRQVAAALAPGPSSRPCARGRLVPGRARCSTPPPRWGTRKESSACPSCWLWRPVFIGTWWWRRWVPPTWWCCASGPRTSSGWRPTPAAAAGCSACAASCGRWWTPMKPCAETPTR
jgi:hypothetical protein